jgi:hypothetical protein
MGLLWVWLMVFLLVFWSFRSVGGCVLAGSCVDSFVLDGCEFAGVLLAVSAVAASFGPGHGRDSGLVACWPVFLLVEDVFLEQ